MDIRKIFIFVALLIAAALLIYNRLNPPNNKTKPLSANVQTKKKEPETAKTETTSTDAKLSEKTPDVDEYTLQARKLKEKVQKRKKLKTLSSEADRSIAKTLSAFDEAKQQNQQTLDALLEEMENNTRKAEQTLNDATQSLKNQNR